MGPHPPFDPDVPFDPEVIPPDRQWPLGVDLLQALGAMAEFRSLDDSAPLLLLPVRLETKYVMRPAPGELRIRIFPEPVHVDAGDDGQPAHAALLPHRWVVLGYHGSAPLFAEVSRPVAADLLTSLDPADTAWQVGETGLRVSPGLAWMFDYDRAVEVGMAVTIPLGDGDELLAEISTLLVVGVDASRDADEAAAELARVLENHERHSGFAFVPQGTPTNNTAGVPAGWTRAEREQADRERADRKGRRTAVPAPGPDRPGSSLPGPDPAGQRQPGSNAARFSRALGLGQPNIAYRVPFADDPERARSRAMNTVLYQALFGRFVTSLLSVGGQTQPPEITAGWRDWLVDHVTGGAPVPAVRVGAQPYGILPVRPLGPATGDTVAGNVERTVQYLRTAWRAAVPNVPVLDPDATDLAGDPAEPLDALPAVIASQPHPARVFTRRFMGDGEDWRFLFESERLYRTALTAIQSNLPLLWNLYEPAAGRHGPFTEVHDQLAFWRGMHDVIDEAEYGFEEPRPSAETEQAMHDQVDAMIDLVENWVARQDPIEVAGLPIYGGVVGEPLTELVGGAYVTDSYEWTTEHLVEAPDAPEDEQAAVYLGVLATRVTRPDEPSSFAGADAVRAPLLHQLIEGALDHLADQADASVAALRTLADLDATTIEYLFRESLGLATHRLDAWATSLASARLDEIRRERPTGVNVGAYGWVVNLHRGPDGDSEGFVHAPSLAHATTAAVLRSAWQAHGHDAAASPAAVDLASGRVRTAGRMVQGVRAGVPLGELLGQWFERGLHDHHLDDKIDDLRQAALDGDPASDATPRDPVDGVRLLDLWRAGSLEAYLAGTGALRKRIEDELAALDDAFDALADATLFEATHQLVNGNVAGAAAVLNAASTGTPVLPELRASRTGRGGTTVEHRVVVLVPDEASDQASDPGSGQPNSWVDGLRDRFAPGIERWLRQLLPDPDRVGAVAVPAGGEVELRLGGLGVSALDLVDLAGPNPTGVTPMLARLFTDHYGLATGTKIDASRPGSADLALDEVLLLASELRAVLAAARPLRPADLLTAGAAASSPPAADIAATADGSAAEPDLGGLAAALDRTVDDFAAAVGTSSANADRAALTRFGRPIPATGTAATDADAAATAVAGGNEPGWQRLRTLADKLMARPSAGLGLDDLTRRAAAVFGSAVPVIPSIVVPQPASGGLRLDGALADPAAVDGWIEAVGRVRPPVGRLVTATLLAELLGAAPRTWLAGQDRVPDGDGWVAVARPGAALGGRTSICVATTGSAIQPGASVSGLAIDRWSERIPRADQVTGVTFHFDAPNARAPQAWILALPPRGAEWTAALVVETLFEVGDWSRLRAVQPEDLTAYGHSIPTSFAPGLLRLWPDAEPVLPSTEPDPSSSDSARRPEVLR
ncbi:hypothetical protein V6W11_25520 [Micromonospora profundi]|uniref:hypothetical protein n=1 Tax=Micromonospora profundi TaxID=1420889 RepID=UPI002FF2BC8C